MPERAPVLIFDLDGTVLTVNSFLHWVLFMLRGRAVARPGLKRLRAIAEVALLLTRRKARLIGHEALKWRLQRLWQSCVQDDGDRAVAQFVATLHPFVRPPLHSLLDALNAGGGDALLATAAAGEYAVPLGIALGFTHILATAPARDARHVSNVRAHKRDAVLDFLAERGWQERDRILFTDHEDDLPLMAVCQTVYWFGTAASERHVKNALPNIRLRPGILAPQELAQLVQAHP